MVFVFCLLEVVIKICFVFIILVNLSVSIWDGVLFFFKLLYMMVFLIVDLLLFVKNNCVLNGVLGLLVLRCLFIFKFRICKLCLFLVKIFL